MPDDEVLVQICDDELLATHPELYHYTSLQGLVGIVDSQSLWATHFEDLNDASEVTHFRAPLTKALQARFLTDLISWRGESLRRRRRIERFGGNMQVARKLAGDLVDVLYETAFKSAKADAMAVPFITSFCTHQGDAAYERNNGLLSQWRGYGGDGGCCIVFDTRELRAALRTEFEAGLYVYITIVQAEYANDEAKSDIVSGSLRDHCSEVLLNFLDEETVDTPDNDMMLELLVAATRYKHRAFVEEREVRVVVVPMTKEGLARVSLAHPEAKEFPIKSVYARQAGSCEKRYVVLFEDGKAHLPIKRIIVGPARDQGKLVEKVKAVVGSKIPVSRSETPLV